MTPVYRFAPSPNGTLHLGHAYAALINYRRAKAAGGRFLLRIEDIDIERCTPQFEAAILRDLAWLGLEWEEPVRRQSEHFADYEAALRQLAERGLVYPAFMTRGEVRAAMAEAEDAGKTWPRDPEGVPRYPDADRRRGERERRQRIAAGEAFSWRLDCAAALRAVKKKLSWVEEGSGPDGEHGSVTAEPARWGDVVLGRRDVPASYHLAVVIDDGAQGVTEIVRGRDLFHATAIHRLLQELLGLPAPRYFHHDLILDENGRKLSKSRGDTALQSLRRAGRTPADIMRLVGLEPGA